ncbi:MAG: succinate dehydrogenase assembly factor 4 [Alphaproteobacteria bacterium]
MSDKHDKSPDVQTRPPPQYRVRKPEGETSAPKSAQNTADKSAGMQVADASKADGTGKATEIGGPKGPEPTRFGDWERDGRCVDF